MKQILHTFAKDVRLFYLEILISLAVTLIFVKLYPREWGGPAVGFRGLTWLPGLVAVLVPVSWWLVIARVVHAESLVGDRQFWITRPYRWRRLLTAKVLFIIAFVLIPFLLAQCLLLREAGFHPFAYMPGMLFNELTALGTIVLPLLVLAAITSNFAKMSLALLIVVLYVAVLGYSSTLLPSASASGSYGDWTSFGVIVCLFLAIIVLQYATRRTFLSRMLLGGVALAIGIFAIFGPTDDAGVRATYPERSATQHSSVELAFNPEIQSLSGMPFDSENKREVELSLPIQISGIQQGTAIKADNAKVNITGSNGDHWESHWQGIYLTWLPGQSSATVSLKVSRAFFERVKTSPVTVELSLALTTLKSGRITRMTLPEDAFSIPDGSICDRAEEWRNDLSCRSAVREPRLMLVGTRFSTADCTASMPANDGDNGLGWIGSLDTDPAEFGITSVWTSSINFERISTGTSDKPQHLCAGAPLAFAPYTIVERRQQKITSPLVRLEDLATRQYM
jgi:hypothetical protein